MQMAKLSGILLENISIESRSLERKVLIDLYIPSRAPDLSQLPLLLINDGQNMEELGLASILEELFESKEIEPLLSVAIHAGADRKMEYGVAGQPDFKGRGKKAAAFTSFIFKELLPFLRKRFDVSSFKELSFAGFSLGGLMALDIVWSHPGTFSKAGVFSGSLWWRSIDQTEKEYDDHQHRIMHQLVRNGEFHPGLKFFFQCGNMDETRDRNKNGIIDSIDDTVDLINELQLKGYKIGEDIGYVELKEGRHDIATWARAIPLFLKWGWGQSAVSS